MSYRPRRLVAAHQGLCAVAYTPIQFQQGMSLPELLQCFGTEAACAEAVQRARRPNGFCRPRCAGSTHCVIVSGGRPLFECHACHRQTSLTVVTLFCSSQLPLSAWFLAIDLISQAKTGPSALELKRHIGVSDPTAWLMHPKPMTARAQCESQHRLSGTVQVDDAYLGGERAGGKPGRGSGNKVSSVVAVSLNDAGNPLCVKVTPVTGFSSDAISKWAQSNLSPGVDVLSDGLGCFAAVTDAACTHRVKIVGQRKPRDRPQFKWVGSAVCNLKTVLSGGYKAFGHAKCADRYLVVFA